jgi:hypothetical protein
MQYLRYLYAALAVLFAVGVVVQVFLAGVGLFGAGNLDGHRGLGYLLSLAPILVVLAGWAARAGGRSMLMAGGLVVVAFVQGLLPSLRDAAPLVAALHPVNALLLFGLAILVARRAVAFARAGAGARVAGLEATAQEA